MTGGLAGTSIASPNTAEELKAPIGPATLSFSATIYPVNETAASAVVTVRRRGSRNKKVTVTLVTLPGTATEGEDYSRTEVLVNLGKATKKMVKIPILKDSIPEGTETIRLFLLDPTGGATLSGKSMALVAIKGTIADPTLLAMPGASQTILIGQTVMLNAGASNAIGETHFTWALAQKPQGSSAAITDSASAMQTLHPDLIGQYVYRLTASDELRSSAPRDVTLTVTDTPPPVPALVSVGGVSLTAEAKGMADPSSALVVGIEGPVDPATLTGATVVLRQIGDTLPGGSVVIATDLSFDGTRNSLTAKPQAPLPLGGFFRLDVSGVGATVSPFAFKPFSSTFMTPEQEFSFVSGTIVDSNRQPLAMVTVRVAGQEQFTGSDGQFFFEHVPAGPQAIEMDPSTVGDGVVYTPMHIVLNVVPGVDENSTGGTTVLSIIDTAAAVTMPGGGVLTTTKIPGAAVDFTGVTARNPDGTSYTGTISITLITPTDVPMPFAAGGTTFWSLQPGGLLLDPPARVTAPLPVPMDPGLEVELWSFNHETFQWQMYGHGTVDVGGLTATSKPGEGLPFTGWHNATFSRSVFRNIGGSTAILSVNGARPRTPSNVTSASQDVGRVFDADMHPLHGVEIKAGSLTVYTDLNGYYMLPGEIVGDDVFKTGRFDSFLPRGVKIVATSRDLSGTIRSHSAVLDLSAISNTSVQGGGLPALVPGPNFVFSGYKVVDGGKIILHADMERHYRDHVISPGNVFLDQNERYNAEETAVTEKLASLGFRNDASGTFLQKATGIDSILKTNLYKATQLFRTIWLQSARSQRYRSAGNEVDKEALLALNKVQGVIYTSIRTDWASNNFPYALRNSNYWYNATPARGLANVPTKSRIGNGSSATGGRRIDQNGQPFGEEHLAGGEVDTQYIDIHGGPITGSFYQCLKASFDGSAAPCTNNPTIVICTRGIDCDYPVQAEEYTEADRVGGLTEDAAVRMGRTWKIKSSYSRSNTQQYINEIRAAGADEIIFNDPALTGKKMRKPHRDHVHASFPFRHGDFAPATTDGAPSFPPAPSITNSPWFQPPEAGWREVPEPSTASTATSPDPAAVTFTITGLKPDDTSMFVDPSTVLSVDFSQPIDIASLLSDSVRLIALDTNEFVPLTIVLDASGMHLDLIPEGELPENSSFVLEVADSVRSLTGGSLPTGGEPVNSSFSTGFSTSIVSLDLGVPVITLSRDDLTYSPLSVSGVLADGSRRALTTDDIEVELDNPAGAILEPTLGPSGALAQVFNGTSTLRGTINSGAEGEVRLSAPLIATPLVPVRVMIGSPVVATFLESLSTAQLSFVSAEVSTFDGESQAGSLALSSDGLEVTFTPAGFLPRGEKLRLRVTLTVNDPLGHGIEVLVDSPFEVVGSIPADLDTDGDGLTDLFELSCICCNPDSADADADGLTDDLEDCDDDHLNNAQEQVALTDPSSPDTDGDGPSDGFELFAGCNPVTAELTEFHGRVVDGQLNPVSGAEVHRVTLGQPSVVTDSGGMFTLPGASACGQARVIATLRGNGREMRGTSSILTPVIAGSTDAGDIMLRTLPRFPTPAFELSRPPKEVRAADLNNDGTLDLVTQNNGGTISVLLGIGDGSFQPENSNSFGTAANAGLTLSDLNGDGKVDSVIPSNLQVFVQLGSGDGTFLPSQTLNGFDGASQVEAVDLNHDGTVDLSVSNTNRSDLSVLIGNGDGSFQGLKSISLPSPSIGLASADFNHDGTMDLVSAGADPGGSGSILLGNGDGTFHSGAVLNSGAVVADVATGDLDGDGSDDVAVLNPSLPGVTTFAGKGDGSFLGASIHLLTGTGARRIVLSDLNADGSIDLAVVNNSSADISILLGNGDGSFQPEQRVPCGEDLLSLLAADIDADGTVDLVTTDDSPEVELLIGRGDGTFIASLRTVDGHDRLPGSFTVSDFNGDGSLDVATYGSPYESSNYAGTTTVSLGNGDGSFAVKQPFASSAPGDIASADFNGDGTQDVIEAGFDGPFPFINRGIQVFIGNGDGSFMLVQSLSTVGTLQVNGNVADLNGDWHQDLVASFSGGGTYIYFGMGDGTLLPPVSLSAHDGRLFVADLDSDGDVDLVQDGRETGVAITSVFLNHGDGSFAELPAMHTSGVNSIVDVNGDGFMDVGGGTPGNLAISLGDGHGGFLQGPSTPLAFHFITLADVNLDGLADLVMQPDGGLSVSIGNGDGTFGAPQLYAVASSGNVAVRDIDADGRLDLVTTGSFNPPFNTGIVTVLPQR